MRFYCYGVDPGLITLLQENDFESIACKTLPDANTIGENKIFIGSTAVGVSDLHSFRKNYPHSDILYFYQELGIAGWQSVAAFCEGHDIRFLRPGMGHTSLIELLNVWYRKPKKSSNIIGVFGTNSGVGVTRFAATLAAMMGKEKKTALLGLNLYNSGWNGDNAISLDRWRQRLVAGVLRTEDFNQLIRIDSFSYLPGNEDVLSTMDYSENEINHLLELTSLEYDVVIADFGSIPESAAWFTGLQQSAIRIMVAHPNHSKRLTTLMKLSQTIGVETEHWHLVCNRGRTEDLSLKTLALANGMLPLLSLPYKGNIQQFSLPMEGKETDSFKKMCRPILTAVGMEPLKRKGWI